MNKTILAILLSLLSAPMFAVDPPAPQPNGAPPPPVGLPIDAWIMPMLFLGMLYGGYRYIKKAKAIA
ncbi:hypothetical protein [Neptunitalea lumnitzerae]|nr:hypothetical protein [Neptunitalea sp. Y10]